MELSGGTGNGSEYAAVGFSPDGRMADSDVYFCTGNEVLSGSIGETRTKPRLTSNLPVRF